MLLEDLNMLLHVNTKLKILHFKGWKFQVHYVIF